jgi:hypothetical protein
MDLFHWVSYVYFQVFPRGVSVRRWARRQQGGADRRSVEELFHR